MKTITIDDNRSILELMKFIMNKIDPSGKHFFTDNAKNGLSLIEEENIRLVFLDIEMPGVTGEEAGRYLTEKYNDLNLIFITGHAEYAMIGHKLHCSAFITKPFDEDDVTEALKWLRLPVYSEKVIKVRCTNSFSVWANGQPMQFEKGLTIEMFAYLVYKNGAVVTNGDLIGVFWDGDPDKQDLLRKYVKDMRDTLENVGAGNVLIKKRGQIGVNPNEIEIEGDISKLPEIYCWF